MPGMISRSLISRFNRLAWGKDLLSVGKENGELELWDPKLLISNMEQKALKLSIKNHSGPVRGLDFNSMDPKLLASGGPEGEVRRLFK